MSNEQKSITPEEILERVFDFSTDNEENLKIYNSLEPQDKLKVLNGIFDGFSEDKRSQIFRHGVEWVSV